MAEIIAIFLIFVFVVGAERLKHKTRN